MAGNLTSSLSNSNTCNLLLADCDGSTGNCAADADIEDDVCDDDDDGANNEPYDMVDIVSSCVSRCVIAIGLYPLNAFRAFGKLPGTTDPCNGSDS